MSRIAFMFAIFCGCLLVTDDQASIAQTAHGLTETERTAALKAEADNFAASIPLTASARDGAIAGLATTEKGAAGKTVIVSVVPVGSASTNARQGTVSLTASAPPRRALVTRYEYATGLTIRTWVDLSNNKTLAVRSDANYPTPIAPEELEEAKALARAADSELDRIVREGGDKVVFYHLVPVSNNPGSPKYGHRLVWLWTVAPEDSGKFVVDLSTNEVEKRP